MARKAIAAGFVIVIAAILAFVVEVAPSLSSAAAPLHAGGRARPRSGTAPCGMAKKAPSYRHVVWIVLENVGYGVVNSPKAPYLNHLARMCGLAINDHAVAHPSLPNYLALTSGSTHGVVDDGEPSAHPIFGPSVFSELRGNWRALEESMPTACDRVTSGTYAARHNPAVYYVKLRSECQSNDVPMRPRLELSAAFTFITPNVCNDMHSCPITIGDAWLARIVPKILASAAYRSGSMALFITFDESDAGATNRVPTYVIAPSVPKSERVATGFTHYSLLRSTETLLHLPLLGAAKGATSMIGPFHL